MKHLLKKGERESFLTGREAALHRLGEPGSSVTLTGLFYGQAVGDATSGSVLDGNWSAPHAGRDLW